jgi:hypothetical protein
MSSFNTGNVSDEEKMNTKNIPYKVKAIIKSKKKLNLQKKLGKYLTKVNNFRNRGITCQKIIIHFAYKSNIT